MSHSKATTDPGKELHLYSRIGMYNEKRLSFFNADGSDYDFTGVTLEIGVKKNRGDADFVTLSDGDGITITDNDVDFVFTEEQSALFKERPYYWQFRRTISGNQKVWLNGDHDWHNGKFDSFNSNGETITIDDNGTPVLITISDGIGASSGHIIENSGTPLTARQNLNFTNGLTASDNDPDTDVKLGGTLDVGTTTISREYDFSEETRLSFKTFTTGSPDVYGEVFVDTEFGGLSAGIIGQSSATSRTSATTNSGGGLAISSVNATESLNLTFTAGESGVTPPTAIFTDTRIVKRGIEYPSGGYVTQPGSLTDKRYVDNTRSTSAESTATLTPDVDNYDLFAITEQAEALLIDDPTGTPLLGNGFMVDIEDDGNAQSITYGAAYLGTFVALPSTTILGKRMKMVFQYNGTNWELINVINEL